MNTWTCTHHCREGQHDWHHEVERGYECYLVSYCTCPDCKNPRLFEVTDDTRTAQAPEHDPLPNKGQVQEWG